jgi:hypothetical protein
MGRLIHRSGMPNDPMVYQIKIKGHLDQGRSGWFEGMSLSLDDNGDTLVSGSVVDQAALHGLLKKVRDLGMPLLSVTCIENDTWHAKGDVES